MALTRAVFAVTTAVLALTAVGPAQAQSADQGTTTKVVRADTDALHRPGGDRRQRAPVRDSAAARMSTDSWSYGIDVDRERITRSHFFQTAIEDRSDATGFIDLGVERSNAAIETCKSAVGSTPSSWSVYDRLGNAYADAGDPQRAIECFERSVTLNPKNESGLSALMRLQNQDAVRRSSPRSQRP